MNIALNLDVDLTVATKVALSDGIGRQGIGIVSALHDQFNINTLQFPPNNYTDISRDVLKVLIKPFNGCGRVTFWTYILGLNNQMIQMHEAINSPIKMAYSMFESDALPELWVSILNKYYDMVIVPDENLISVYKNSGVRIPIFVIPLGIMVENLLARPAKTKVNDPFTFGLSAGFWMRKNHLKTLEAFAKKFGNDPKFKLKLHGRFGSSQKIIEQAVADANLNNVELLNHPLSAAEYDNFMDQIDCYVFPSMGEGFSITPREMMALGKPCILSNHTCHKTICNSGFVIPLRANVRVPAYYEVFDQNIGYQLDCNVDDLANLMLDVVNNYDTYLQQAQGGREWVKQYLWSSLKPVYTNLIKPKEIVLGNTNLVTSQIFQTNDKKLLQKLKSTFK